MSCNGCRILRKGCHENCMIRQSLQGIESPLAQANATVFVAKFFGRAGLMSFLSSVPESQRPDLFQSLLFEACGRTINPVNGAVGLLGTGNWHICQSAVETVLQGGMLRALPEYSSVAAAASVADQEDLDQGLMSRLPARIMMGAEKRRDSTPASLNSDESDTTTFESGNVCHQQNQHTQQGHETKLLRLFY